MGRAAKRGPEQLTTELEEARRRIAELEAGEAAAAFSSGLVQHLFDGFVLLDPQGVLLDVNPALCAMTGFSREELIGVGPPHPFWPPEAHAAIREELTRDLAGDERPTALTFMRKNGERFPVLVAHSLLRDERGAVTAMVATIKDVSELMAAQAELADSERRFRRTFDQAPVGAAIVTLDGHFQRVNAAFQRMTGYSEDELITMTFLDITRPEERQSDAELVGQLLRGDIDELVREKCYVRKDGGGMWGLLSARVARDDAGEPLYFLPMIVDVDDRQRAQEALAASELQYRAIADHTHDWEWWRAPDGDYIYVSPSCATISGRTAAEFHADPDLLLAITHPDDRDRLARHLGSPAAGTPPEDQLEFRIFTSDGEERVMEHRCHRIIGADGTPLGVRGSNRDITARKQAEQALRESEERFKIIASNTPDHILMQDRQLRYTFVVNPQLGLTEQDMIGKTDHDFLSKEEADQLTQVKTRVLESGQPFPLETSLISKAGEAEYFDGTYVPKCDAQGKVDGLIGYFRNVTARKLAEQALRESEKSLREAQRLAHSGNWQWTVATDAVKWSEALFHINGRDPGLPAPSFAEMSSCYTPESWKRLSAVVAKTLQSGESYKLDLEIVRPDGTTRHSSARGETVCDAGGKIVGLHGTVQDVTERKQAEDEIRRLNAELEKRVVTRTAELAAVTTELEAFAYSTSHDLRAPLRAIDGFSLMVMEDAADVLGPEDVHHLERVRGAAQRMGRLIDDLLGLSRLARRDLYRERVDVSALAREVADELLAEHEARVVEVVIAPDLAADADPRLLRVILRSLLDNAWKFTAKHEAARVEVGVTDADGERAFFVRDDGAGFNPDYAEHLFGAFQRMHTAEEFEGDGIGLAMVQRLVNRHGGTAWAESQVEQGASFFFTLSG